MRLPLVFGRIENRRAWHKSWVPKVFPIVTRVVPFCVRHPPVLLIAAAALCAIAGSAVADEKEVPESRHEVELSFAPLVKKTAPAVVNIFARKTVRQQASPLLDDPIFRRFFGNGAPFPGMTRERVQNSLGSGVIVDATGLIVTNHHVIEGADQITVALSDRREFDAKVISSDEHTDLAILKIGANGEALPTLPFGDSDGLEVGDMVLAIGDPFGVGQTVTSGIVSALARTKVGVSDFSYFIQTDAAINPGNSGGALVDMKGQLVGINTALYSRSGGWQGIGFAIPSSMVKAVVRAAASGGTIAHPWLGVAGDAVNQKSATALGLERPAGVLVTAVHHLSPALAAGLRPGDVIVAANGHETDDPEALKFRIGTLAAGDTLILDALHEGKKQSIEVKLIAAPERPKSDTTQIAGANPLAGATVANLSPALADELGVDDMLEGVIVTAIRQDSTAAQVELQPGDLVLRVNETPVDSVSTLANLLTAQREEWRISIGRGGNTLTLRVRP